ncbi:UNVERIFIED_CONTAM: Tyrosine--tRNA ligase, chloroplastic/mitochondrial [Sesamum radiatum]|uniref:Tyrosine--tRNA ligase n=1 Tax=Sesamum radiatum TaxID=300843 RepID=A0AAW2JQJ0_SESRA
MSSISWKREAFSTPSPPTPSAVPTSPSLLLESTGFDPTAQSLHLGNLLGIIVLSWFLRCGHQAVALVGGATGRIGDPSGKSLERPELDPVSLDMNVSSISATIQSILGRVSTPSSVTILNNYDWWKDVKLLDFLREVGRFARVGTMMSKESVRKRLESDQGMSYTEFTYQLLQGYDFLRLFRDEGVNVQIGAATSGATLLLALTSFAEFFRLKGLMDSHFPFSSRAMAPSSGNLRTVPFGSHLPSCPLTSSTSTSSPSPMPMLSGFSRF